MSRVFSDDFKETVRSQTDIVSLIAESVALQPQRGGKEFVGLCPFHDDHRPSMRVYADRQSFRCWSCSEGGDCFSYVMKHERIEFREALEMLAARANIELPKTFQSNQDGVSADNKNRLYDVLAWAENEFHECLLKSPMAERARCYLADRKLTKETIARFRLGYHPDNWNWLTERARNRFAPEQLHAVRLIGQNESGRYYDNFVDRVLFPIHDAQGRPVAFGGRVLPDSKQTEMGKYWNSPESIVFNKSRMLYALEHARDAIVKSGTTLVMEGYTDCIMAHQSGVTNVVATLGTALTEQHVTTIKRFGRKVVLVYDGDTPGKKATERALPKFLAQEIDLRILTLPGDLDPADFMVQCGGPAFAELLHKAVEAWEHKFQLTKERYGWDSIDGRHQVLQEMLDVLSDVPIQVGSGLAGAWQMREHVIVGSLAQRLSIPEEVVRQRLQELRKQKARQAEAKNTNQAESNQKITDAELFPEKPTRDESLERELLEIIFTAPETVHAIRKEVSPDEISNGRLRQLLELCFELADSEVLPAYARVTATLEDPTLKRLAVLIDEHAQQVRITSDVLVHTLSSFKECRERKSASLAKLAGPHAGGTPAGLNQESLARLRQATELNQKRVSKKTLT